MNNVNNNGDNMNEGKKHNPGKLRFFKRVDEFNAESDRLIHEIEKSQSWIIPKSESEKNVLAPADLRERYLKNIFTLGIGPAIAKQREKKLEELYRRNGIKFVKAGFIYLLSQPVPESNIKAQQEYKKALVRLLEYAISYEYMPVIRRLITRFNVEPNAYHLYLAMLVNSPEIIDYLIQNSKDPSFQDKRQFILQDGLIRGVEQAQKAVEALLKDATDINRADARGRTVLHLAVPSFPTRIIGEMINKGASINVTDNEKNTPLHFSILVDMKNIETVDLLLENHADVNAKNSLGQTALAELIHNNSFPKHDEMERILTIADKFLSYGANPNTRDKDGDTPLHYLCMHSGETPDILVLIKFMLDQNANPTIANHKGETPLHYAAFAQNANVVQILLDSGADPTARDKYGRTPINRAQFWDQFMLYKDLTDKTVAVFEQHLVSDLKSKI